MGESKELELTLCACLLSSIHPNEVIEKIIIDAHRKRVKDLKTVVKPSGFSLDNLLWTASHMKEQLYTGGGKRKLKIDWDEIIPRALNTPLPYSALSYFIGTSNPTVYRRMKGLKRTVPVEKYIANIRGQNIGWEVASEAYRKIDQEVPFSRIDWSLELRNGVAEKLHDEQDIYMKLVDVLNILFPERIVIKPYL